MRYIAWIGLVLIIASANAQAQPTYDAIVASLDDSQGTYWDIGTALNDFPAVARAVAQPDHITNVADDEQQSMRDFFAGLDARGADGIRVDGNNYIIGITLPSSVPPGAFDDEGSKDTPALGLPVLLSGLAVAAVALRRH